MSIRLLVTGLTLASLASSPEAQVPFGSPTHGNGFTPWLRAETPWMGNPNMAYTIGGGPPSGLAIIAASLATQDVHLGNLNLLVGLSHTELIYAEVHTLGTDGSLVIPRPLFPPILHLAGLVYYTQVGVTDRQLSWATSNALTMELRLPPQVFIGNSFDLPQIVDPKTGDPLATVELGEALASPTATAAVYAMGGRYLYLTDGQRLAFVDTAAPSPFATEIIPTGPGQFYNQLRWDRIGRRLVTLRIFGELAFIDGDPSSPTFTQVLSTTTNLDATEPAYWDLSADGTRALIASQAGAFKVVEIDPTSSTVEVLAHEALPTYTHPTPFGPIIRPGIAWLSPEGSIVYVNRQSEGLERYDIAARQWIDHNPTVPGTQPIGPASSPPVALTGTTRSLTASDGSFTLLRTPGAVMRVDFDPLVPHEFSIQPVDLPSSATGATSLRLSSDRHTLIASRLTSPISFFIPFEVEFYDLDSGISVAPPITGFGLPAGVMVVER